MSRSKWSALSVLAVALAAGPLAGQQTTGFVPRNAIASGAAAAPITASGVAPVVRQAAAPSPGATRADGVVGVRARPVAAVAPELTPLLPRAVSRGGSMMIVGGVAMVVGAVVGGDSGNIIMVGGAVIGLIGLWQFVR